MPLEFLERVAREAFATEAFVDEHLAMPREDRAVGDDAREAEVSSVASSIATATMLLPSAAATTPRRMSVDQ